MTVVATAPSLARNLCIITGHRDFELSTIHAIIESSLPVDCRGDLEALFGQLLARDRPGAPRTLDLIGHSTPTTSALQLGDWVIDTARPAVSAFFREIAEQDVLPRLGIHAVRLLGSGTAETEAGRRTIDTLARILELEVHGVLGPVHAAHFDAYGLRDDADIVLCTSADLRGKRTSPWVRTVSAAAVRSPRALDIDALPRVKLAPATWPRHIASVVAREILGQIRRDEGALMPGLLASPCCEVALPSSEPGAYHLVQILFDYELVRVYPDGPTQPAIVYPVRDRHVLRALVTTLPVQQPMTVSAIES
jgi:hypothetical protein